MMASESVNRIAVGIEKYQARIERNENNQTPEQLDTLYKNLEIKPSELAAYMTANSVAFASGRITFAESQLIYQKLKSWNHATLAERITITQVMGELLKTQ